MPAEAGIQRQAPRKKRGKDWIPAPRLRGDRLRGNDSRGITSRLQVNLLGTYHLAGGSNSDYFSKENSRK
ncbi:MAG TPA: hypothetical protein VJM77_01785 [Nitrospiria bacterium]|nr:hypothetical protein [Nitrospiria bacterium]